MQVDDGLAMHNFYARTRYLVISHVCFHVFP